jgi:CHAT domain
VRPRDVQRAMLDHAPQIVHFSGHGDGAAGLAFEDESGTVKLVSADALASLFELFADGLQCVVLNACYSDVQAKAIVQHVPYVIGMSDQIGDKAAIEFAVAFYDALGGGREVEFAYKNACVAIKMAGISQADIPILHQKPGSSNSLPMSSPLSLTSKQTHNLTEKQLSLLKWMVAEVRADRLEEEEIWIVWSFSGTHMVNYQGTFPDIKPTTLDALQDENCLVFSRRSDKGYKGTLTRRAYEIVDSSFGNSAAALEPPPSSPVARVAPPAALSSFQHQRLVIKQAELQKIWHQKVEQLTSLRQALAIGGGGTPKFVLHNESRSTETEIKGLESQLEKIEQDLTNNPLKK